MKSKSMVGMMREYKTQQRGDEVVKCACGLPMRRKNWTDHWRTCRFGSSVPVTQEDIQNLEAQEARLKKEADDHQLWLEEEERKRRIKQVDKARSEGRVSW